MKFVREELTHLDPHLITDSNLHPELFIDRTLQQELLDQLKSGKPVTANTVYFF